MNKLISAALVSGTLMAGITACNADGDKCNPDKSPCTQDDGGHYIPIMIPGYSPGYYPRLGADSNSYGPRAATPPRAYSPPAEEEDPGTGGRSFGGGRGSRSGGRGGR